MSETHSAKSLDRISVNNPALLSMLRENSEDIKHNSSSMEDARRVYVDSPVLGEEDSEKYRFVSGNVEDFDESLEEALKNSETARDSNISQRGGRGSVTGSRYEDRNPKPQRRPSADTQYVVRSKQNSRQSSGASLRRPGQSPNSQRSPEPHAPIHRPLHAMRQESKDEKNELQLEEAYQKKLKNRLLEKAKNDDQILIPKLDLVDSDEELAMMRAIRGDKRSAVPDEINLRDSLDEDDEGEPRDSLDWKDPPPNPFHVSPDPRGDQVMEDIRNRQNVPNGAQPYADQHIPASEPFTLVNQGMPDNDPRLHNMFGQSGHPPVDESNAPPHAVVPQHPVQQPYNIPQNQFAYPQTQLQQQYPYPVAVVSQGPVQPQYIYSQGPQPQLMYVHNPAYQAQSEYIQLPHGQVQGYYDATQDPAYYQGYYNANADPQNQYENQGPDLQQSELGQNEQDSEGVMLPNSTDQIEDPGIDYVEMNKKTVANRPKRTYGQIFSQRKDTKENVPPRPMKALPGKTPTKNDTGPNRQQNAANTKDINQQNGKPSSAESIWQRRAQSLTHQKQDKLTGGKKAKRTGPSPLKKYPSESKVNDMKETKPYYVEPIQGRPVPHQSMAEPIRSEIVADPSMVSPGQPITHTVYTEDGQKVSVDINLKVISPPPHKPLPLGPIPQTGRSIAGPVPQQPPIFQYHPGYAGVPPPDQFHPIPGAPPPARHMAWQSPQQGEPFYQPNGEPTASEQPSAYYAPSDQPPTPIGSPYKVLPPIGSADSEKGRPEEQKSSKQSSPRKEDGSSYMAQFHQKKTKRIDYKEYTLKDYRKLNQEIRLGGLGPNVDSEEQRERREKFERQQEYARQINHRNRQEIGRKPPPKPKLKENQENEDVLQRRKLALEYAKNVPKPKVRDQSSGSVSGRSEQSNGYSQVIPAVQPVTSPKADQTAEMIDLDKLRQRHEDERQKAALIRQKIETA